MNYDKNQPSQLLDKDDFDRLTFVPNTILKDGLKSAPEQVKAWLDKGVPVADILQVLQLSGMTADSYVKLLDEAGIDVGKLPKLPNRRALSYIDYGLPWRDVPKMMSTAVLLKVEDENYTAPFREILRHTTRTSQILHKVPSCIREDNDKLYIPMLVVINLDKSQKTDPTLLQFGLIIRVTCNEDQVVGLSDYDPDREMRHVHGLEARLLSILRPLHPNCVVEVEDGSGSIIFQAMLASVDWSQPIPLVDFSFDELMGL